MHNDSSSLKSTVLSENNVDTDCKPDIKNLNVKLEPAMTVGDLSHKHKQRSEVISAVDRIATAEAVKIETGKNNPVAVEHVLANLQTIVSETATQPDIENASQPDKEEASLPQQPVLISQSSSTKDPGSTPQQPQDDLAKLEQVCSEIQNQAEEQSLDQKPISDETAENSSKVQERNTAAIRGRGRGRGRRGGRRTADVQEEDGSGNATPTTRSSGVTRGKGRGRGRQARTSESQQDTVVVDLASNGTTTDNALPEPRRSSRMKRARRHPDMVDHEETSGRRRRGRGGRAAQVEDSRPMPAPTASDVYDFHESEDEDINLGLKAKVKKDATKPAAGRSPAKAEQDDVRPVDSDENRSSVPVVPSTRKSKRLRVKAAEDEPLTVDINEEGSNSNSTSQPIIVLESSAPVQTPLTTVNTLSIATAPIPLTPTTPSRGRSRSKAREGEPEDDPSVRKSPRGHNRGFDPQIEPEKGVLGASQPTTLVVTGVTTTTSSPVPVPSTASVIPPTIEECKSEAELVDPVTGVVTRVKVCEEGQYVTDTGDSGIPPAAHVLPTVNVDHHTKPQISTSVICSSNSTSVSVVSTSAHLLASTLPAAHANIGSRPGVTMTVVSSGNIGTPPVATGAHPGDVSVELVTRPRAPLQVPTQGSIVSPALGGAIPNVISTKCPTITPSQGPPVSTTMPAIVNLGSAPRPTVTTPAYNTKPKIVQPQQQIQQATIQQQKQLPHLPPQQPVQQPSQPQHLQQAQPPQQQPPPKPGQVKAMAGVSSPGAIPIGNHVRKSSISVPAPAYYPPKTPVATAQTLQRSAVVPKTSTTSSQPQPTEHVIEGRNIGAVAYDATHSRVVPTATIDEAAGHHRIYMDDQRTVHGEFRGVNIHPRYPNSRFLEPPRVDVTRLPGSSPSTPSPAGRPHEPEPSHATSHHSSMPGYDVGEMMRGVAPQYLPPHVYTTQYYSAMDPRMFGGEKMITQMPLDMKVEKGEPEKLESHSTSGTPGPADFPSRPSGAPAALAPRGQSSPHVLASPHHDRSTDSPQVAMVYSRLYDRYYNYPGRAGTPGAPGTGEHEARSRISSPSGTPLVYPAMGPAEVHHQPIVQISTPQYASQVPPQLQMLIQGTNVTWTGLLGLKQEHAAVQMIYVSGSSDVARGALPIHPDGTTSVMRIGQRMRLEQTQLEGVARKIQMEAEHCMLLALPHGRDSYDIIQQHNSLRNGIINYLVVKQAAGIVNVTAPGTHQPAFVVHIFPPCDFANENLARISPDLLHRVAEISYLLVVIATC